VDTSNSALAVECPSCGLLTQRFLPYCRNCGFALWAGRAAAGAAFQAWQQADPARALARPYDLELPAPPSLEIVDYQERAHRLGIHLFPPSSYPFVICVGFLFLGLAAVPFPAVARILMLVVGLVIFLVGVVGWVVLEDVRMYQDVVTHEDAGPGSSSHSEEQGH
jgi:hypothetical protein